MSQRLDLEPFLNAYESHIHELWEVNRRRRSRRCVCVCVRVCVRACTQERNYLWGVTMGGCFRARARRSPRRSWTLGWVIRPVSESHTRFTRFLLLLRDRRVSWKVISPSLMSAPSFWRSHASHANRLYLHTCSVPSRAVGHAVLSFAARPLAPIYPPRPGADWHYLLLAILPISS